MNEILKLENVRILDSVKDWIEAINVAVQPLVEQGYCESRYITGIIENTKKFGPYYVLCENLALIHASSEQGVIKKQIAVTVLKNPIKFKPDGYNVRILLVLAAEDRESHIEAIQAISNIFSDKKRVQKILDAKSTEEIFNVFINSVDN